MRGGWWRVGVRLTRAAATVVLGASVTIGLLPVPPAAAAATVKVLQLNICHSGVADCFTGDRVLAKARSVIGSTRPQVLSVNEANGQRYGNIVMVAEALAGTTGVTGRYANQDSSNERRVWACLPAGRLTACTTHLSARSGTVALAQCRELMDRAARYAATAPTVVAGDMNLRYQGNPNVQDCNRSGFYRKGDGSVQHVFATTTLAFVSGSRIGMDGTTDHPAWLVTTTFGRAPGV